MFYRILFTFFWINVATSNPSDSLFGVHPDDVHFYDPSKDFTCKDGSQIIPFVHVNDNFCDCGDSSDEPSTSACEYGTFYCANKDYVSAYIPSSHVNDGVCDCCDGSDEFQSNHCKNICSELRELDVKREEEAVNVASDDVDDIEEESKFVHMVNREQLEILEQKLKMIENEKKLVEDEANQLEEQTTLLEKLANEALKPFRTREKNDEQCESDVSNEFEKNYIHEAFNTLDRNDDGVLELYEMKTQRIFDLNKNGAIEDREIKWYYDAMPVIVNEEVFRKKMWKKMGRLFVLEHELDKSMTFQFDWGKTNEDDEDDDDDDVDEEDINYMEKPVTYDDSIKQAVFDATNKRRKLAKVKKKLKDLQQQKDAVEKTMKGEDKVKAPINTENDDLTYTEDLENFGPNERSQYFPMEMHCFKYRNDHHLYRLCPFWGVTQQDKEMKAQQVDLGKWVGWAKEKGEPIMLYKNGTVCENGNHRTTKVKIFCGSKNLLVHVDEPQMCVYRMEFKSPAGCHIHNLKEANQTITSHDEL